MGSDSKELLGMEPLELRFPFETKKQISCSMQLTNGTDDYIGFKVKTTSPKKYCVRPNSGIVPPRSTSDVIGTSNLISIPASSVYMGLSRIIIILAYGCTLCSLPKDQMQTRESDDPPSLAAVKAQKDQEGFTSETSALISKLTEERNSAIQQSNKLRQELDLVRRDLSKQNGGFSFAVVWRPLLS
ncbi:Vesicle-associated membrane protein/synaptobrevin-binding protein [Panicum miliaceum]|uniref:Vesicle-associated membrane protein/synaptobrevin-binding protein n=1 Tax=Panicum miliaceum TaxID=4540 RepID=A0A3L6PXH1_PANMI|nr:Vesicle-associated membrane protein/synaptobrevin-binding protein [Panicum miliaceum]